MRKLMAEAAVDESAVDDIAASPTIWWAVQRSINEQKSTRSPWPPALKRWVLVAASACAAAIIAVAWFASSRPVEFNDTASTAEIQPFTAPSAALDEPEPSLPAAGPNEPQRPKVRPAAPELRPGATKTRTVKGSTRDTAEIKSDFIALSYAGDPESGQVVRVKVPSSMMVSLGLVASVKRPTALVDAEVLVGDDGLTRAIRFIRTESVKE